MSGPVSESPAVAAGAGEAKPGTSAPAAIGFIGLGQMGAPMASRLTDWPGGLVVFDARAEAIAPLADRGARAAASPGEVAAAAGIICVMVRDDEQVGRVVRELAEAVPGRAAGVPGDSTGQVIVAIHSTIGARTAPLLAERYSGTGIEIIDAPVSGGFMGAHEGRLAVMVGGSREAYERCREPFGRFADLVMHMGPVGAGTRAKLARNLLHFVAFTAAAESQRLAEAAGIDLRKLTRIVRHSDAVTGGPGSIMLRRETGPVADDDPLREILEHVRALGEKDLAMALDLGAELGIDLPMARYAADHFAAGLGVPH
jgi:3-hydroxyisobutyrate dehydrogenase-like beta-hydroxyacid dehydrogenase